MGNVFKFHISLISQVISSTVLLVVWFISSMLLSLFVNDLYDLKRVFSGYHNFKLHELCYYILLS